MKTIEYDDLDFNSGNLVNVYHITVITNNCFVCSKVFLTHDKLHWKQLYLKVMEKELSNEVYQSQVIKMTELPSDLDEARRSLYDYNGTEILLSHETL